MGEVVVVPVREVGGRVVSVIDIGTVIVRRKFDNLRIWCDPFFAIVKYSDICKNYIRAISVPKKNGKIAE